MCVAVCTIPSPRTMFVTFATTGPEVSTMRLAGCSNFWPILAPVSEIVSRTGFANAASETYVGSHAASSFWPGHQAGKRTTVRRHHDLLSA